MEKARESLEELIAEKRSKEQACHDEADRLLRMSGEFRATANEMGCVVMELEALLRREFNDQ
jgi:hypothetical protein